MKRLVIFLSILLSTSYISVPVEATDENACIDVSNKINNWKQTLSKSHTELLIVYGKMIHMKDYSASYASENYRSLDSSYETKKSSYYGLMRKILQDGNYLNCTSPDVIKKYLNFKREVNNIPKILADDMCVISNFKYCKTYIE